MKKITFYLMMLLSVSAFAQIEINENIDDAPNNGSPDGWTADTMIASANFACGGSGKSMLTLLESGSTASLTSPNYTAISNGTAVTASFSYNIFEQDSQFPPATFSAPATDWGSLVLEYSTDGGTAWTTITAIDDSNYTFGNPDTCQATANIDAGVIANGSDFQIRFAVNAVNVNGFRLLVLVDNISINQVATEVPNCDVTLTSPLNGSVGADTDTSLMWQAATGIPTGYTVTVGTTSGGNDIVDAATTATNSYPLSGLTYDTAYFVTIVSFNGIGDATGCTEESFTTRSAPIAGATCSSPIVVTSFPYTQFGGDTAGFENNIDVSPCNNTYMNGNDVFYEITPTTDVSLNIEVIGILPATSNRAGVHVVKDCPDVSTECVAYEGSFSGDSRSLFDVVLLAGNTYFVVLSTSNANNTFGYDLIITENSCINPTIDTLTPVADCGNDEFSVNVDVSYLGNATSLTLSDDFAGTADITNITSTGLVNVGPYPSGTIVNYTLTNDDDGSCLYEDSTFFYCPPTNDDCGDAIDLTSTINTDGTCTMFTSATNAGATESLTDPSSCSSSNTNDVWFSFIASSDVMILEYLNLQSAPGFSSGGVFQSTELLSGNCGALTSIACYTSAYVTLTGLTNGNTYFIRSKTNFGDSQQTYDICLREPSAAPSNDECANADTLAVPAVEAGTESVSGSTVGSTLSTDNSCETSDFGDVWYVLNPTVTGVYEFSIEENPTGQDGSVNYSIYEGSCGALTTKTPDCTSSNSIITLKMGTTYYAMVQSNQSNPGLTFNLNITKLPDAVANNDCSTPATLTESTDNTGNNSISGNINLTDIVYPSAENCSSSRDAVWYSFTPTYTGTYFFEFERVSGTASFAVFNGSDCSTIDNDITGLTSCFLSGSQSGDFVAGNTYLISVHASSAAEFGLFVYPDPSLSVDSTNFEAFKYYPNPVGNTLTVEARSSISQISVHNIVGQKVMEIAPNSLATLVSMDKLNKGVYFVTVKINNSQKTFKVIKE